MKPEGIVLGARLDGAPQALEQSVVGHVETLEQGRPLGERLLAAR
jgi:hypothetical protein